MQRGCTINVAIACIVCRFMELSKLNVSADAIATGSEAPALAEDAPETKQANNLLLFLCYLCVFNTVHHDLVFAIMDKLVNRLTEVCRCCHCDARV